MNSPHFLPPALRVLVVDDSRDHVRALSMLLHFWGHRSLAASNGPTALEQAFLHRPDAAILDIDLPGGLDGCEVAWRLRGRPQTEGILLIALTGSAKEDDRQRCWLAGFDHFLLKPADPEELKKLLAGFAPPAMAVEISNEAANPSPTDASVDSRAHLPPAGDRRAIRWLTRRWPPTAPAAHVRTLLQGRPRRRIPHL